MPTQTLWESILEAPGAKQRKAPFLVPSSGVMLQQAACSKMEWLNNTFIVAAFSVPLCDEVKRCVLLRFFVILKKMFDISQPGSMFPAALTCGIHHTPDNIQHFQPSGRISWQHFGNRCQRAVLIQQE
jgi:hypothetical protein